MLDLETLGLHPGSVIASIGAVRFGDNKLGDEFHVRIHIEDSVRLGFEKDPVTVAWWAEQEPAAREELAGTVPLHRALDEFYVWAHKPGPVDTVWGNGAGFDNALLIEAYRRLEYGRPWPHRADRCYRTVKALYPQIEAARSGVKHNAVDDAVAQAIHMMRLIEI